ncbi:sulfurtransferase [Sanguibacter sp. A247]|uniref:sulfurtransferase n=1 Tax=unclassified Sanguibacter TaxID=2645534 RepID=UPI003FD784E7
MTSVAPLLTPSELDDLLSAGGDVRVFDATTFLRTTVEAAPYSTVAGLEQFESEHIPGAGFVDVAGDLSDPAGEHAFTLPSPDAFAAAAGALGIGDDTHVVVYDTAGNAWATRVWWLLRVFGHDAVSVLDGGLGAWKAAGLPVESGPAAPVASATFTARLRPELVATKAEVTRAVAGDGDADGSTADVIVNALDPETFAGTQELSPYARRGRIPGSRNLPLYTLLDQSTGRFLATGDLAERLEAQGVLGARRAVTYCGGGIAATLPAFAAFVADGTEVAVYDGSLSEWTADPSLPVELG